MALEFVSLGRLHRQMFAARSRYVVWARGLYADVVRPIRDRPTAAALQERDTLVLAAWAVVRRAEATQDWPLTDRTLGIMLGVLAGVVTSVIARFALVRAGAVILPTACYTGGYTVMTLCAPIISSWTRGMLPTSPTARRSLT